MGGIIAGKPQIPTSTAASPGIPVTVSPSSGLYWDNVDERLGMSVAGMAALECYVAGEFTAVDFFGVVSMDSISVGAEGYVSFTTLDPATITIRAPSSGVTSYSITLPTNPPSIGQIPYVFDTIGNFAHLAFIDGVTRFVELTPGQVIIGASDGGDYKGYVDVLGSFGNAGEVLTSQGNALPPVWAAAGGVTSFNTRTGAVTLLTVDVTNVSHGFVPAETTNTALGSGSLGAITSATGITGIGSNALAVNTSGVFNTAIGADALAACVDGNVNVAVGYQALASNIDGDTNVAIGYRALHQTTTGNNNTAVGLEAGRLNTTGSDNTIIGHTAFTNNETGSGNVMIGNSAGAAIVGSVSNRLEISNVETLTPLVSGTFDPLGSNAGSFGIHGVLKTVDADGLSLFEVDVAGDVYVTGGDIYVPDNHSLTFGSTSWITGKTAATAQVSIAVGSADRFVVTADGISAPGNATLGNASTDTVTVNGYIGVGGAPSDAIGVYQRNTALTGVSQYGFYAETIGASDATTSIAGLQVAPGTAAAAFACANVYGLSVTNASKGAGSTITTQTGLRITDQTQGATNYGITCAVSSGADKWCVYAQGTANNAFVGKVRIGSTVAPTVALDVTGAIAATTTIKTGGYTVATLPEGTTGDRAYVTDATAPTYLGALTGGGAVVCPVFYNGTAWVSG